MKNLVLIIVAMFGSLLTSFAQVDYVQNEVIVVTRNPIVYNLREQNSPILVGLPVGSVLKGCADVPLFTEKNRNLPSGSYWGTTFLVELPTPSASSVVADSLKYKALNNLVAHITLNVTFVQFASTAVSYTDPDFSTGQYHMKYDATAISSGVKYTGWQHASGFVFKNTATIKVAVLDGGLNFAAQDIVNAYCKNTAEIPANGIDDDLNGRVDDINGWDFVSNDNDPSDDNPIGHGSHVFGIIGARNNNSKNICGVVTDSASVLVVKVTNSSGTGTDFQAASGYYYALGRGAKVINMSFGSSSIMSSLMTAIATGISSYKCMPVAAVGNTGGSFYASPASGTDVLTVGNANSGGVLDASSSYSDSVDVTCRGLNVKSISATSSTTTVVMTGSSMAAPFASGWAWWLYKIDSTLSVHDAINIIRSYGNNNGVFSSTTGYGYLVGFDTMCKDYMITQNIPTFTACSGKQQLPVIKYFTFVDSLRFGLPSIVSDSVNTDLLSAGTYTYKIAVKSEPRPGVFYLDTLTRQFTITGSGAVVPTISITPTPGSTVCSGASVNFTSSITGGGSSPSYVWRVNGTTVGSASSYAYTPTSGDVVYCTLTSSAGCATPPVVTSNTITMTVNPSALPSVTITPSPAGAICAGTTVTFTALPAYAGSTPTYQWYKNGLPVGSGGTTYNDGLLVTGDLISCQMTSSYACATTSVVTSNTVTATVNPVLVPAITINATPAGAICAGTMVNFTSTIVNGGSTPSYTWKVNGITVGSASSYSSSTLANGDIVTCTLGSSATCATPGSVGSNTITMTVNPVVTPGATINATPAGSVCVGTTVTFSLTTVGGGSTPAYQWYVNSVPVGTGGTSYSYVPASGDAVYCNLTSSAACATPSSVGSNTITMTVSSSVTPSISVVASPGSTVCTGTSVTFTASPSGGGSTPTYQWYKNSIPVGSGGTTYIDASLVTGDVITCELTSSLACVTSSTATSTPITMTVNSMVTPAIAVSVTPGASICSGTSVTFSATPFGGGSTPSYQWYIGSTPVGTGSVYVSSAFASGDAVKCVLTSSAACASPTTATSVITVMTVTPSVTPGVTINAMPGANVCAGTTVNFTSAIVNGGSTPVYTWKKNGVTVGSGTTYSSSTLATGDFITCALASSATCATAASVNSNTVTMTVNAVAPVPVATLNATPVFVAAGVYKGIYTATIPTGISIYSIDWYLHGEFQTTTSTNSWVHDPLLNGHPDTVYAVLRPIGGCYSPDTSVSPKVTLKSPVSVAALTRDAIHMYPNPVQNLLSVEGMPKGGRMVILNILGQQIMHYTFNGNTVEQIELQHLVPGMYTAYLSTSEDEAGLAYKIIKE